MTTTKTKSILLAIAILTIGFCASGMDIITLKNGGILKGQIYQTDDDGSLYISLTDGTKRYVFPDEIASKESNDETFTISSTDSQKSHEPGLFNIYVSLDALFPTDTHLNGEDYPLYQNEVGLGVGFSSMIRIKKGFIFNPGIEFGMDWKKLNPDYTDSQNTKWAINARLPILFGYQHSIRKGQNISLLTGPVLDITIATYSGDIDTDIHSDDFLFANSASTNQGYSGWYDDYHPYGDYYSVYFNRINAYWRFAVKYNIDKLNISLNYSIGITNRIDRTYEYRPSIVNTARMRQDLLQVSIGYNF